jgi:hypothetical protein
MIVAVHKMGHAVMASHFGWPVVGVSVSVLAVGKLWKGLCTAESFGWGLPLREYARRICDYYLAGPVAQVLYTGRGKYSPRRLKNMIEASARWDDTSDWDEYTEYRARARHTEKDIEGLAEFIGSRMCQIVAMAKVLRRRGSLNHYQFTALERICQLERKVATWPKRKP